MIPSLVNRGRNEFLTHLFFLLFPDENPVDNTHDMLAGKPGRESHKCCLTTMSNIFWKSTNEINNIILRFQEFPISWLAFAIRAD